MRINTNVSALNSQRILGNTGTAVAKNIAKLSSGFRINKAADDAAGMGIANKLRADIRSMKQAARNAEQANSILQIMDGAGQTLGSILDRMKELATQAASDNVDTTGRAQINTEYTKLEAEFSRIVSTTKFQGQALLTGTFGTSKTLVETGALDLTEAGAAAGGIASVAIASTAAAGNYTVSHNATGVGGAAGMLTVTNDTTGAAQTLGYTEGSAQTLNFDSLGITINLNNAVTEAGLTGHLDGVDNVLGGAGIADDHDAIVVGSSASGGSFLVSSSATSSYASDKITLDTVDLQATALGTSASAGGLTDIDLTTSSNATTALLIIDEAITDLADSMAKVGAAQNRVDFATQNVKSAIENFSAAESTIRDVDMAQEMTDFSKNQILQQAGTAMLAQANSASQSILKLLG